MARTLNRRGYFVVLFIIIAFCTACILTPDWSQIGENIGGTAEALSTKAVGAVEGTVEAYVNEMSPVIEATLAAIPPGVKIGEGPEDIPVIPDTYGFYGDKEQVVFLTSLSLEDAVYFYKEIMPSYDWKEGIPSVALKKAAYLTYDKDDRRAIVVMTISGEKVAVRVTVSEK